MVLPNRVRRTTRSARAGLLDKWRRLTSEFRLLPNALIIGAQRCGTSSLYDYLISHPDVPAAARKEVHYFDEHYRKGLAWYRSNFALCASRWHTEHLLRRRSIVLEASPYYLFHPHVPTRVKRLLPNAQLIVLLRNPVDRALSHYHHEVRKGRETLAFQDAVDREPERLAHDLARLAIDPDYQGFSHRRHSYLARGIYVDQLDRWLGLFPPSQLLVLRSEDLFSRPSEIVRDVFRWLGLSHFESGAYTALNRASYPTISPELRSRLAAYFRPHNDRLYARLGRDFEWR